METIHFHRIRRCVWVALTYTTVAECACVCVEVDVAREAKGFVCTICTITYLWTNDNNSIVAAAAPRYWKWNSSSWIVVVAVVAATAVVYGWKKASQKYWAKRRVCVCMCWMCASARLSMCARSTGIVMIHRHCCTSHQSKSNSESSKQHTATNLHHRHRRHRNS